MRKTISNLNFENNIHGITAAYPDKFLKRFHGVASYVEKEKIILFVKVSVFIDRYTFPINFSWRLIFNFMIHQKQRLQVAAV